MCYHNNKTVSYCGGFMSYNIAICDDEALFAEKIKKIIIEYNAQHEIQCNIDLYSTYAEINGFKKISDKYDIVFLDLDLENDSGFNVAKSINENGVGTYIIFITAFNSYAIEGYKYEALRYIIKSSILLKEQLNESLDTAYGKLNKRQLKKIIKFNERILSFAPKDLYYIESSKHILKYHFNNEIYTLRNVLDNVEKEYGDGFLRIHQSYLVNMEHIYAIDNLLVQMDNNVILNIAKSRYKVVREKYLQYKGIE